MDPPEPEGKAAGEEGSDAPEQKNLSTAMHLKRNTLHLAVGKKEFSVSWKTLNLHIVYGKGN